MTITIGDKVYTGGEDFTHNLTHDKFVYLLEKLAASVGSDTDRHIHIVIETDVRWFGDSGGPVEVLFIEKGTRFLDALAWLPTALNVAGARAAIPTPNPLPSLPGADLISAEIEAMWSTIELSETERDVLDDMSKLAPAWRKWLTLGGCLLIDIDYGNLGDVSNWFKPPQGDKSALLALAEYLRRRAG